MSEAQTPSLFPSPPVPPPAATPAALSEGPPTGPRRMYLIDGSNQAFRAFFAIQSDMRAPDGLPTRALFGFANLLRTLLREHRPDYVLVAFDRGHSFRNALFPDYKGQRPDMPEDLRAQWPELEPLCEDFGVRALSMEGFEADDIIGTLAVRCAGPDLEVSILSSDKDFGQLVGPHVSLLDLSKGERAGPAEIVERWGVPPERIVDLLSLMGDTSDNVPGVRGVGEKTAAKLIQAHGDLEGVLRAAEAGQIKGKTGEAVAASRGVCELARQLVTLHTDVPLPLSLDDLRVGPPRWDGLAARLRRYNFRRLLAEVEAAAPAAEAAPAVSPAPASAIDRSAFLLIHEPADVDQLAARLRAAGRFAFDTETTSLDPLQARVVGMSFGWREGGAALAAYVPVAHVDGPNCADALERLGPLLADPAVPKIGQNLKYDLRVLQSNGRTLAGIAGDTMLADYLTAVDQNHGLDALAQRHLGHQNLAYADVTREVDGEFARVPVARAVEYAAEDALVALLLDEVIPMPEASRELYTEVEVPLIPVLAAMENAGIRLDLPAIGALAVELRSRVDEMVKQLHAEAGRPFNVNSTKALQEILFDERGLKPGKKTKTGYSTAADVLEQLAAEGDRLCALLLEYRELAKLLSTYVETLPSHVSPVDGRVHTSFHQAVAQTGRLSSNDPNLQNIPIRTPEGRRIRACFIPEPGHVFLSADYSQIELRVLAHFCGEGTLVEAFQQGEDIHRRTAAEIFGVSAALVSPDQRRAAKAINFGLIYGMSAFRLSNELGVPRKTAQAYMDGYFERYPQVRAYMERAVSDAQGAGYAVTLYGRRRAVHGLDARNPVERGAAERIAINTPVQGTAADLIKRAMLRVHAALADRHPRARLLLQVHDELVLEVPEAEADAVAELVRAEMEGAAQLLVPLKVDVGRGASWDAAH